MSGEQYQLHTRGGHLTSSTFESAYFLLHESDDSFEYNEKEKNIPEGMHEDKRLSIAHRAHIKKLTSEIELLNDPKRNKRISTKNLSEIAISASREGFLNENSILSYAIAQNYHVQRGGLS